MVPIKQKVKTVNHVRPHRNRQDFILRLFYSREKHMMSVLVNDL